MPKPIASADLVSIYGDPDRARAEAEKDLADATADLNAATKNASQNRRFFGHVDSEEISRREQCGFQT
jgi:hypothetical protein